MQDPDNTLAPGTIFTYTLKLQNNGPGYSSDTHAVINFDPSVSVRDFHSNSPGIFVTSVTTDAVSIRFDDQGDHATAYAYVIVQTNPAMAVGAVALARANIYWTDTGSRTNLSNIVVATGGAATADSGRHGLLRTLYNAPAAPVAAGTQLALNGDFYAGNEAVSFWLNNPDGTVSAITTTGGTDPTGRLSLTFSTTGLAPGTYSLVAHGICSGMEGVAAFTVSP